MAHRTLEKLTRAREHLLALVGELSEEALDQQHGDGWTVREILTHLLNAEEDHCKVAAVIARGDLDRLPRDFSLDDHNAQRLAYRGKLSKDELLAALAAQRERTTDLFNRLTEEQLAREGNHPALGKISVGNIFRVMGVHERMHAQDIDAALGDDGDLS